MLQVTIGVCRVGLSSEIGIIDVVPVGIGPRSMKRGRRVLNTKVRPENMPAASQNYGG